MPKTNRCAWCGDDPLYVMYHDEEWGLPSFDDQYLFEFLVLEAAQAGLSWITILRKREGYRRLFCDFDVEKIAAFTGKDVERLMQDASIVRNRLKIESTINNAARFQEVQAEFGSFARYLWAWVDNTPLDNAFASLSDVPASTELSKQISKDLKKRGFRFVGETVIYAYMQSVGMVNDHVTSCFRHHECAGFTQDRVEEALRS